MISKEEIKYSFDEDLSALSDLSSKFEITGYFILTTYSNSVNSGYNVAYISRDCPQLIGYIDLFLTEFKNELLDRLRDKQQLKSPEEAKALAKNLASEVTAVLNKISKKKLN